MTTRTIEVARAGARLARWCVLLLSALAATACDGSGAGDADNHLGGGPGCEKDREVLIQLLAQPMACAASETCPTGSHCDPVRSACDWQCIADSDCGVGLSCTCDGFCVGDSDGGMPDPEPGADPSCPRVRALLVSAETTQRTCLFDEECPHGSHCDATTGRCAYACLGTDDATLPCSAGRVCDCFGRCAAPEGAPPDPTAARFALDVTPDVLSVVGTSWPVRTAELSLSTPSAMLAAGPAPAVRVRAPAGILLAAGTATPTATELVLTSWSFAVEGDRRVARATISVGPVPGLSLASAPWAIEVRGGDGVETRGALMIVPAAAGTSPTSGTFRGEIVPTANGAPGTARIAVTAWASPGFVLFFDESRTLSPSGRLGVPLSGTASANVAWATNATSAMTAAVIPAIAPTRTADGDLEGGAFDVRLPYLPSEVIRFEFELIRTADLPAGPWCTLDAQCGAGAYCEEGLGVCVAGADWRAPVFANQLTAIEGDEWATAASWFTSMSTPGLFGLPWIPGPRSLGYSLACHPTGARTYAAPASYVPGFRHRTAQPTTAISGELTGADVCAQPAPIALGRERALVSPWTAVMAGDQLLESCLRELEAAPPSTTATDINTRANAWFSAYSYCVSPHRFYPMWSWLTGGAWAKHRGGSEARLLNHALDRWLGAHAFLAMQAPAQQEIERVISGGQDATATARLHRSIAAMEHALDLALAPRTADALATLPRDVLRHPDYRDLRPVSYYTFDAGDMNGQGVIDVAGEANTVLPTSYGRSGELITTALEQWVNIPRGPAELYGELAIGQWLHVPATTVGQKKVIVEYGDATNLVYQFYFLGNSAGQPVLWAYHGPRSSGTGAVQISLPLTAGQQVHLLASRLVDYDVASGGAVTWRTTYRGYVNGTLHLTQITANPMITSLDAFTARGNFAVRGSIDELTFWDEAVDPWVPSSTFMDRSRDNAQLDTMKASLQLQSDADHVATESVVTGLLELSAQYLRAVDDRLAADTGAIYAECAARATTSTMRADALAALGRAQRYAFAVEALATRMQTRATTVGCGLATTVCGTGTFCATGSTGEAACTLGGAPVAVAVTWQARFDRGRADLDVARRGLSRRAEDIVACDAPLGVPADALPIFFGDPAGTSSRFFAASDYLVGTWAVPAVAQATASLEAARDAWTSKRSSEIQQILSGQEKAQRLEQLELSYAQPLNELCGMTGIGALDLIERFASGQVTPRSCFRSPDGYCATVAGREDARCYHGEAGKSALAIFAAKRDIDIARAAAHAAELRYEAASAYCSQEQQRANEDIHAITKHEERMAALRRARAVAAERSLHIGVIAQTISSMNPLNLVSGHFAGDAADADYAMQQEEAAFQASMQIRSIEANIRQCFFEADQQKYSIDVAHREVARRAIDVQLALLQLQNQQDRIAELAREGEATLAREQARDLPGIAFHFWLDRRIDRFRADFAWALRLTYLSVRAVEHEYQQSLSLTDDVLRASTPDHLRDVLQQLQQEQAGRTINGRRPEETSVVLSLRADVLRLQDRAAISPGERGWSAARRFGERLRAPDLAVYDDHGAYLGQGVPFSMRETGALTLRCAERVWRINATVQGDVIEASTPSVPVIVLKRNTFSSQWCDGRGDGAAHQVGSVRPSTQLFRPDGTIGDEDDAAGFSSALVYPWFNVVRSEFYRDQYTEGSSEELAGRGLYGDYVLLFPESGLLDWTDDDPANDFPLHRIEDVLIRFDLLSVDDLTL